MTDARPPIPASSSYIQNGTSTQTASNFNVSGNGTVGGTFSANIVDAATQFDIGGNRILGSPGTDNLFAGVGAGQSNTTGQQNALFGARAGKNTNGSFNSFFGYEAGVAVTVGGENTIFGADAGFLNSSGSHNAFFGFNAGDSNTTGNNNTILGSGSDVGSNNLINATAIGANARVNQSNSLVLGGINGVNGATADTNVGIGTTAPTSKLHVTNGDIRVTGGSVLIANPGTVIITSPNGACWGITVSNSGALSTFPVSPCP